MDRPKSGSNVDQVYKLGSVGGIMTNVGEKRPGTLYKYPRRANDVITMALSRCSDASGKASFPCNELRFPVLALNFRNFPFGRHPWIH